VEPASPSETPAPAPAREPELTVRALLFGGGLGALLSAGNVYTGLKTSFIDGGSITAALLGFAFFSTFARRSRPFGSLENNIAQTTASSAAITSFTIGLVGSIPALQLMGFTYPPWAIVLWGLALGGVGVVLACALRRKLIVAERLPFPTGAATAEVIETISSSGAEAMRRARWLMVTAVLAMAFAWFRDGKPSFIPQAIPFGSATAFGVSLVSVTVTMNPSPLLVSTGLLIGLRSAFSMLVGGTLSWVLLAPWLVKSHITSGPGFGTNATWLMWPGVGLLLASSFVPLVMDWRGLVRSFRDIPALLRRRGRGDEDPGVDRFRLAMPLLLVSVIVMLVVGRVAIHLPPLVALFGLLIATVLANVCARSAGETDIAPTGLLGTVTQILFAGNGPVSSLFAGSITAGVGASTTQMLWAFRTGEQLKASPRAQVWAQLLGAVLGALVSIPAYFAIMAAYGIGTEAMPCPSALSWKATAEAVRHGFSSLPPHAPLAGSIAFGVGLALTLLGRGRAARFVPSAAAMGTGMLSPFSLSFSICIGGLIHWGYTRLRPSAQDQATLMSVAAGGIAGESVMGVIVAFLLATGLL
jgi:uncharacterized oligopeptide transporter (OPT) family protein